MWTIQGQYAFGHAWGVPVEVTEEHRLAAEARLPRDWAARGTIEPLPCSTMEGRAAGAGEEHRRADPEPAVGRGSRK